MESKKVLVFLGSPRKKGNSTLLAEQVMDGRERRELRSRAFTSTG